MTSSQHQQVSDQKRRPVDTLGARLVLLRRDVGGISQREAAARTGISFGQWQGLEDDHREVRGVIDKLAVIAATFHFDLDWLLWGGPLDPKRPGGAEPGQEPAGRGFRSTVRLAPVISLSRHPNGPVMPIPLREKVPA